MTEYMEASNAFVFEQLMIVAEGTARRYLDKGASLNKAVAKVTETYGLEPNESKLLVERLRKPEPKAIEPLQNDGLVEDADLDHVIYFDNQKQLDEAVQHLMDRSIDWSQKSSGENKSFVQFADSNKLAEAQSALRRKYDFVESRQRLVASMQFDNLHDYSKVLEFMRRQGMLIEYSGDVDLDEDYDQYISRIAEEKRTAEKENRPYTESKSVTSFVAKSRIDSTKSRVDPVKESRFRMANARKRWRI